MSDHLPAAFQFDSAQFGRLLETYTKETGQEVAEVLNRKAFFITLNSQKNTPSVSRETIEQALGVVGYKIARNRKTGAFKRAGAILGGGQTLALILAAVQLRKQGTPITSRAQLEQAARKLVGRRQSARGSLKAGWVTALRQLGKALNQEPTERFPGVKQRGYGRAATPAVLEAEFAYDLSIRRGGTRQIDPRAAKALNDAWTAELQDMENFLERRLQERLNRATT